MGSFITVPEYILCGTCNLPSQDYNTLNLKYHEIEKEENKNTFRIGVTNL